MVGAQMAAKKSAPKPKRRSPISRAEGERRLIEAATSLLREKPFSEVGVRDIAARADVNHGFVHTWFGSKNDLLKQVLRTLVDNIAATIRSAPAGSYATTPNDPDVILAVRLAMWLKLEDAHPEEVLVNQLTIKTVAERYVEVEGLRPDIAHIAAQQATAIFTALISYGEIIDIDTQEEGMAVVNLWRHVLGLLREHPPA